MIPDNLNLENVLKNWDLTVYKAEQVGDVFKVWTDAGCKNLKVSPLIPQRLSFAHLAIKHLHNNGFDKMVPLIPSLDGKTFVSEQNYAYTLFDWIEGRQCDFTNTCELINATKVLAEFHQKSFGFAPPNRSNMRSRIGKCLNHFEKRYQDLLDFQQLAKKRPDDRFAIVYLNNVEFFLPLAQQGINKLRQSHYFELANAAKLSKPFCHGDPAARNFILTPDGQTFMIDFDSCRLDLPVMDLIKFARRVLKKYHWRFDTIKLLLNSYREINPISQTELDVIKAVFYFPQKFWRMAERYFREHDHHTPERSIHKLQKYVRNKEAFAQIQTEFDRYQ